VGLNEDNIRFREEGVVVEVVVGPGPADLWEVVDPPILEGGVVMSVLAVLASVTDGGVEEGSWKNIVAVGQKCRNRTLRGE